MIQTNDLLVVFYSFALEFVISRNITFAFDDWSKHEISLPLNYVQDLDGLPAWLLKISDERSADAIHSLKINLLLNGLLGTNFGKIHRFLFINMHLKMFAK